MLRREHHIGRTKERIGTRREHANRFARLIVQFEIDLGPDRFSDPVSLHQFDRLGPIDVVDVGQQSFCVGSDTEHPLLEIPPEHRVIPAIRSAFVGDFFIGQHGPELRTPVHRNLCLIGEAVLVDEGVFFLVTQVLEPHMQLALEHERIGECFHSRRDGQRPVEIEEILTGFEFVDQLTDGLCPLGNRIKIAFEQVEEDPLRPSIVFRVGCGDAAGPVVAEPEALDLPLDVLDVLFGRRARVHTVGDGVLFCGQAKRIVSHRVEHVEPLHPLISRDDVGRGVPLGVPHMQPRSRRIGKHIQHIEGGVVLETGLPRIRLNKRVVFAPKLLPLRLNGRKIIT